MRIPASTIIKLARHAQVWTDVPPLCKLRCLRDPDHCPRHSACRRVRLGYRHLPDGCECRPSIPAGRASSGRTA